MFIFRQISYLSFIGFAALLGTLSLQIPATARGYPLILAILVAFGALVSLIQTLLRGRAQALRPGGDAAKFANLRGSEARRMAGFALLWLLYPLALGAAGFIVATILWLAVSFWILALRPLWPTILGAAIVTVALSVLFTTVFYIPVPQGPIDAGLTQILFDIGQ